MANPFKTKFKSQCQGCGDYIGRGDLMYAVEGAFMCEKCAREVDAVCECGNFKKEKFNSCFECNQTTKQNKEPEQLKEEANPGDIPF